MIFLIKMKYSLDKTKIIWGCSFFYETTHFEIIKGLVKKKLNIYKKSQTEIYMHLHTFIDLSKSTTAETYKKLTGLKY